MEGKIVSHYKVLEKLGGGGMGIVYKARDIKLDRYVALKFLPPTFSLDEEAKQRFIQEAKAASALEHNNICNIHEIDETDDGQLYIVMAYYNGETLKKKIEKGTLDIDEAINITIQIAEGLSKAHEKGIIHRDIKPANIFVTKDGVVKILDFGLAKVAGQSQITKTSSTIGTVAYMSPEQARGETVDHTSDIWSLGVVLYEMITGINPFKAEYEQAVIHSIIDKEPEPIKKLRKGVPDKVDWIIRKALEKKISDRYQSVEEMLYELRIVYDKDNLSGKIKRPKSAKRNLKLIFGSIAALFTIVILIILYLTTLQNQNIDSIAVLPMQNLSNDPDQEYFVDGMTDALINELAKISGLRVISRTSMMMYKDINKPLPEIADELNVDALVEGAVFWEGNRVRITAKLIQAVPEQHLWANNFEGEFKDVLKLQQEVSREVVNKINVTFTPQEQERLTSAPEINPEAYRNYLMGRFYLNKFTKSNIEKGIEHFTQSIQIDSGFAQAYSGLAFAHAAKIAIELISPRNGWPKVRELVTKALAIDPYCAEALVLLGNVLGHFNLEFDLQEGKFKSAIELEPNNSQIHWMYAQFLSSAGRYKEALEQNKLSIQLDPISPITYQQAALNYLRAGQLEKAEIELKSVINLSPDFALAHYNLGRLYLIEKRYEEAIKSFEKATSLHGDSLYVPEIAQGYALMDNTSKARYLLDRWLLELGKEYSRPTEVALVFLALGDNDQAIAWLEKAYDERSMRLWGLKISPRYEGLRDDPRFVALVEKIGLK